MPITHHSNTKEGYAVQDKIDGTGKGLTEATASGNPATRRQVVQDRALEATTGQAGLTAGDAAKALLQRFSGE